MGCYSRRCASRNVIEAQKAKQPRGKDEKKEEKKRNAQLKMMTRKSDRRAVSLLSRQRSSSRVGHFLSTRARLRKLRAAAPREPPTNRPSGKIRSSRVGILYGRGNPSIIARLYPKLYAFTSSTVAIQNSSSKLNTVHFEIVVFGAPLKSFSSFKALTRNLRYSSGDDYPLKTRDLRH